MEAITMENEIKRAFDMEKEFNTGLMVENIQDIEDTIKLMGKEDWSNLMEIYMKENDVTEKLMDEESTHIVMEANILDLDMMIINMDMELRADQTDQNMKGYTHKEKNTEREDLLDLMAQFIQEIFVKMI